ncbi:MAG: hypothetical protein ACXWM1_12545 [Candidatus Binataceae bacterium]
MPKLERGQMAPLPSQGGEVVLQALKGSHQRPEMKGIKKGFLPLAGRFPRGAVRPRPPGSDRRE